MPETNGTEIYLFKNEWHPYYLSLDELGVGLTFAKECTVLRQVWLLENMREHFRIQNAALGHEMSLTAIQLGKRIHLDMTETDKSKGDSQLWLTISGNKENRVYNAEFGANLVLTMKGSGSDPSQYSVELDDVEEGLLAQRWGIFHPQ